MTSSEYGTVANGYFANLWNAASETKPSDAAWLDGETPPT
jgi:hypothetical protein